MWELDGQQFSLKQIEAILNKEKYKGSVDDFIAEKGYTKVAPKVIGSSIQKPGEEVKIKEDIIAKEKKEIDLAQAEVDAAGPIELEEVVLTPEDQQTIKLKPPTRNTLVNWMEENNEPYIEKIKQRDIIIKRIKDLGNPNFFITQASNDLYNNLIQQKNKLDEELIPYEDGRKMSIVQSLKNSLYNAANEFSKIGDLYGGGPMFDIASSRIYESIFGDAGDLPDTWLYEGLGDKEIKENIDALEDQLKQSRGTIPFIESVKAGEYGRAIASAFGAVINITGSLAYVAATGGSGYFFDFVSENWLEYNKGKAARLGITLEELVEQNLDENAAPIRNAAFMSLLENIGAFKILNIGKGKAGIIKDIASSGIAEGITEWGQCATQEFNRVLGITGDAEKARAAASKVAFSASGDCAEAAVQGAFGGAGARSGIVYSSPQLKASYNIRSVDQTQQLNNTLDKITNLRNTSSQTKDETVKQGIQDEIFSLENKVKVQIEKNNQIVNVLTVDEITRINNLGESANSSLDQVGVLMTKLRNGEINKKEFNQGLKGFKQKYEDDKNAINEIKEQASSKVTAETPIILSMFMSGGAKPTADQKIEAEVLADKDITDSEAITENITEEISDPTTKGEIQLDEVVVTAPAKKGNINELARVGYDNLTPEQLTDFKNQYTSVALAAIGYDPTKGSIKPEDAQSFVDEQFVIIAKNYRPRDPKTNKKIDFTTYVYNTIGRRGAALYGGQEALAEAGQTTSLDDERAAQVADIPTTPDDEVVASDTRAAVNIMGKGPQAEVLESEHVALIEASPIGKEILETGKAGIANLNKLAEDVGNVKIAEELNIPVEVINDPKVNILKKHNPSNIQRYILKNAQLILSTLKANTNVEVVGSLKNPDVKIKVGGKPLKLPRKLLDLFFDKTDVRVGPQGFPQYKVKPNLTIKNIHEAVGIIDGKINPNFEFAKSDKMQAAKGLLLLLGRARTNAALEGITTGEVAGTILSTTPKKAKTATERAIDYLTAKEAEYKNVMAFNIPPSAIISALKGGLKIFNKAIKAGKPLADALVKFKNHLINSLKQYGAAFGNAVGRIVTDVFSRIKNYTKAAEIALQDILLWQDATTDNLGNLLSRFTDKDGKPLRGAITKIKNKNDIKLVIADIKQILKLGPRDMWFGKPNKKGDYGTAFTSSSKAFFDSSSNPLWKQFVKEVKALRNLPDSAFGNDILDSKGNPITFEGLSSYSILSFPAKIKENIELGKIDSFNERVGLIHKHLWKGIANSINSDISNVNAIATYLKLVGTDKMHWHKMGAQIDGYSLKINPWKNEKGVRQDARYEIEHAMPATDSYIYLLGNILLNRDFNSAYDKVIEKYKVIALDKAQEIKVNKNLKRKMPSWWTLQLEYIDRYFNSIVAANNGGIQANSIVDLNGVGFDQKYNIKSPSGRQEIVNIEAEIKANETINQGETAIKNNPNLVPTAPKNLNKDFNIILEEVKGIAAKKRFSQIVARRVGRNKGRISKFFFGPGAQDFELLYYNFLGRGRKGEQQKRFFEDNLMKPYARGVAKMEIYSQQLKDDYAALKKLMPETSAILYNKIKGLNYTNDQALRIYLWDKAGYDIPGLSKRDRTALAKHVQSNPNLLEFANGLTALSKQDNWVKPDAYWDTSDLLKDIYDLGHKVGRKQFLEGFINNSNEIFSESNLNKIEATYGIYLREAIESTLYRMKNGTNRKEGMDRNTAAATQWVSNSVGAIMWMNVRASSFQLLSMFNYINWQENNIFAIGQRVLDVKQLSKDIYTILTSAKIKQRFAGEGRGIEESEIAAALRNSRNKPQALLQYLLKIGFTFTRAADALAIGLGGAPYYRNNVIAFEKQGFSKEEAEAKAWEKFSETTEKFQQSSDPRLLSPDQATTMGRWILSFQNTPGQYTRSMVKDMKDFVNRRRIPGLTQAQSDATYLSRISYYGVIQNFFFVALANALFTLLPGWDDEEEEMDKKAQKERNKQIRTINNMISTLLRGSGIYGAFVDTLKNVVIAYQKEQGKDPFSKDNSNILVEIMNLMPTVGSKIRKINNALKGQDYNKDLIEERGWDVTIDGKVNLSPKYQVFSNLVEGVTNIPMARLTDEVTRISEMLDARNTTLERVALTLGYRPWDLNIPNEEHDKLRLEISDRKRREKQEKKKLEKEEKKRLEDEKRFAGKSDEEIALIKTQDEIRDLTKAEQVTELEGLGLSKKDIRALRLEDDRINKIIELRKKTKTIKQ
jgi:hypothetical protein